METASTTVKYVFFSQGEDLPTDNNYASRSSHSFSGKIMVVKSSPHVVDKAVYNNSISPQSQF